MAQNPYFWHPWNLKTMVFIFFLEFLYFFNICFIFFIFFIFYHGFFDPYAKTLEKTQSNSSPRRPPGSPRRPPGDPRRVQEATGDPRRQQEAPRKPREPQKGPGGPQEAIREAPGLGSGRAIPFVGRPRKGPWSPRASKSNSHKRIVLCRRCFFQA